MTTTSSKAYLYLVKIISSRDYSEFKLREKMREKQFIDQEINEAINEIKAKGYLRENVYSQSRVRIFMDKGYSPFFIRQKLAEEHLNLSSEEIDAVFLEYSLTPADQIERLIRKKIQGKMEIDYAAENKILRYLISKGHDFKDSKKVLKSIIGESVACA